MHKQRLLKLANHLKSGKLGHKKFDFSEFNTIDPLSSTEKYKKNGCGTMGCALGECPIIFPKYWKFNKSTKLPQIKNINLLALDSAKSFFKIDRPQTEHLFLPESQNVDAYGGKDLDEEATRKQVAANIFTFIKKQEEK